jgi:DNA repair exonuclease SbcCD ATPase subunit
LAQERHSYDDNDSLHEGNNAAALLTAETLRRGAECPPPSPDLPRGEERISLFWRVFGGTILSIAALVAITVYNQFSTTLTDLRKELNQLYENRAELLRKDEFNNRLNSVWTSMKELQTANQNLAALNERAKLLEQQLDRQTKNAEEERKEMQRKLEEQRKLGESERADLTRRLEEQRRTGGEERKELLARLEGQRQTFETEQRELTRHLQQLSERLAKVESRKTTGKVAGSGKKN